MKIYHNIYEPVLATINSRNKVTSCCVHKKCQLHRQYEPYPNNLEMTISGLNKQIM